MWRSVSPTRRALGLFVAVMLITTAELTWWIIFNVRSSANYTEEVLLGLERDRWLAADLVVGATQNGATAPAQILASRFAALEWRPGVFPHHALNSLYPGQGIFIRPDHVKALHDKHQTHIRMFVSEGTVFLAMVVLGATLIFRTLRRDVFLMRQQTNFLSAVTHELKSPLASLRLYTETMQMRDSPPEQRQRYLENMRQDITRLESLVGNLLAVARLEGGEFVVHPERIEMAQEVRTLARSLAQELQERGATLQADIPDVTTFVRIDPAALNTMVRNLVDNALKYGGAGAPIILRLRAERKNVMLEVIDQGIGLSADEISKVFQKFYRVGDEMVRQTEGSGLGLYLVRALAHQCGGEATVESAGLRRGCTFQLKFPCESAELT